MQVTFEPPHMYMVDSPGIMLPESFDRDENEDLGYKLAAAVNHWVQGVGYVPARTLAPIHTRCSSHSCVLHHSHLFVIHAKHNR